MKKTLVVMTLLVCLLTALSCAGPSGQVKETSQSDPEWVTTGGTTQYPSDFYITGVGGAEVKYSDTAAAQAEADSKAIAQVAKQIEVVIAQLSSSFEREVSSQTGESVNQRNIWEKTAAYVKIKVEGVRIEKRHYDQMNNRLYSLAVLDRMAQGKMISDEITALKTNATALTVEAERSQTTIQKVHRSVAAYGLAIKKMILAVRKNQYLGIIAPQMVHDDIPSMLSGLQTDVTDLMSQFSFEKRGGDNQKGVVGGNLPQPLQLKVYYRNQPVPSIPVAFTFARGTGNLDQHARSNTSGHVSTTVSNLGPTGEKINKIRAFINVYPSDPKIQQELSTIIAPVYAQFSYELPPVEEIRVAVFINEYNLGYQQHESYLKSKVIQSLSEAKLQVVKEIPKKMLLDTWDVSGGPKLGQKLKQLSSVADMALVGEVRATLVDTSTSSSLIIARARAAIKLYDLASSTVIGNVDLTMKGAGPDRDEAGRRTLKKISGKAAEAVEKEIKRTLFGR